MRKLLRPLHRWFGLPLGLVFLLTLCSGVIVGAAELLTPVDRKGQTFQATSVAQDAAAVAVLLAKMPRPRSISMPTPEQPYYEARSRNARVAVSVDGKLLAHADIERHPLLTLTLRIHRNLALGREGLLGIRGAVWVAWISLIAVVISLVGVWLWWPRRATFRPGDLWPSSWRRAELLKSHLSLGVVSVAFLVLLGLTGAGITYRTVARDALGAGQDLLVGLRETPQYLAEDWLEWLNVAKAGVPETASLRSISFPRRSRAPAWGTVDPSVAIQFRFVTEQDWFGFAGSRAYVDPGQSAYLGTALFAEQSLGQKLYLLMVSLHTGRGLSHSYLLALVLFTALAAVMVFSGVCSYCSKLAKAVQRRRMKRAEKSGWLGTH